MSVRKAPLSITTSLKRTDPDIAPHWSEILLHIRLKTIQINELRALEAQLIAECDDLVLEAVDDGEKYKDIADAAGRTTPWVQTALRRKGKPGPRVRLMTKRAADAKRAAESGDEADDLLDELD